MLNLSPSDPLDYETTMLRMCTSLAELTAVGALLYGQELALECLRIIQAERQPLQRVVQELRRVGRKQLAEKVLELAKDAPRAPWWHSKRPGKWRTKSAQIYIDRKKAEHRAAANALPGGDA
jgi:hypothetical protein